MERDKALLAILDGFVCVKLDPAKETELARRYHMEAFPTVLFLTPAGRPIKLVAGINATPRLRTEAQAALDKYVRATDPSRWMNPTKKRSPAPRRPDAERNHPSSCPAKCEFCGPAIEKGLAWLLARQTAAGSFVKPASETQTTTDDGKILTRSIDHIDTALTGVAGLALLTTGSAPGKGPQGAALSRARAYLQKSVRSDGVVSSKGDSFVYYAHSMFETSLAAMFLAECQALQPDAAGAAALASIARGIENAQDERTGGWGYSFESKRNPPNEKTGWRLLATTHVALSALNAIADAGVAVSPEVRARGVRFLVSCVGRNGAFTYRPELRGMDGYPGATGGALYAIARAGRMAPELATTFAAAERRFRDDLTELDEYGEYWWYMVLFAALESHDAGEGSWRAFREKYRDLLIANQADDGSFDDPDKQGGAVFATSVALFALQLEQAKPPICGRRSRDAEMARTAAPTYLKVPDPLSRVKVFEQTFGERGRYLADLIVAIDAPAAIDGKPAIDDTYLAQLADALRGASRILFDVSEGQMALHRVTIQVGAAKGDVADVTVTHGFYSDPAVPRGAPHGITMVTKRTELRGGRDIELPRIGQWVKLPYSFADSGERVPWHHWGLTRVIGHELCHYLFGVQDEYGGCTCFMGDLMVSELCGDDDHSDARRELSCWSQARLLYPKLTAPDAADAHDAGPWDPPQPRIEIVR